MDDSGPLTLAVLFYFLSVSTELHTIISSSFKNKLFLSQDMFSLSHAIFNDHENLLGFK